MTRYRTPPGVRRLTATALRALLILAASALVVVGPIAAEQTSTDATRRFIEDMADRAMAVMEDRASPEPDREARLKVILGEALDLDAISRFVLGRWRGQITREQRAAYDTLFPDYVLTTYSRRLLRHRVDSFTVTGARPSGQRDIAVESRVDRPDAPSVELTWRVREIEGDKKIVDLLVDGLSLSLTHRSEVASVVRREGMNNLLARIRAVIAGRPAEQASASPT